MLRNRIAWLLLGAMALLLPVWTAPTAAQDDIDPVEFRFAHLSPDAPNVDVYADGVLLAEDVAFGTVTEWQIIAENTYDLAVTITGDDVENAVFTANNVDLSANADVRITVAAYGSVGRGTLAAAVIREDFAPTNNARLEVFHAFERAPAIDVISDDLLLVGGIGYPNTQGENDGHFTLELPPRVYRDLRLEVDNSDQVLLDLGDVEFEAGTSYFVAAVGPIDAPQAIIVTSDIGTPEPVVVDNTDDSDDSDDTDSSASDSDASDDADDADATDDSDLAGGGGDADTEPADDDNGDADDEEETVAVVPAPTVEFVNIRIAHLSPDAPAIDLYVNGIRVAEALAFRNATSWVMVPGGGVDIAITAPGEPIENALVSSLNTPIPVTEETQRFTIAAIGSFEDETFVLQGFVEDYTPVEGEARVEIFHALEGGSAVNVLLNNSTVVSNLAYPGAQGDNDGQFGANVPAASADINIVSSDTGEVIAFVEGVIFAENTSYLLVVTATQGGEILVLRFATPIPQ